MSYPKVGASLILLGSLIFGAGMFLIAQMYHITVHYPNGPLMWGLGVLPLAYLLRFKSLISLAILDLLIWLGMEVRFWISYSSYYEIVTMVNLYFMAGDYPLGDWAHAQRMEIPENHFQPLYHFGIADHSFCRIHPDLRYL